MMPKQVVSGLKAFFGRYLDSVRAQHGFGSNKEAIEWLEKERVVKGLSVSQAFRKGIKDTATHRIPNQ